MATATDLGDSALRSRRVLAACFPSHDANPSPPGGAIDAPGSAVVGVGAASERGTLSAASVGHGGSVGEPPTSVGGGDHNQPRRLGAALAACVDGCTSNDIKPSSPDGAIDAPGSAVVGVGAATERDTLSAASVGRDCSVGEPTTSVGGGDRGQSRRLGAALAARAGGCSSHDANQSSPGGAFDARPNLARFLAEYPTLPMAHTPPPSLTTRPSDVSAVDTPSVLRRPLAVTNAARRMNLNHHSPSAYEDVNTEPERL